MNTLIIKFKPEYLATSNNTIKREDNLNYPLTNLDGTLRIALDPLMIKDEFKPLMDKFALEQIEKIEFNFKPINN